MEDLSPEQAASIAAEMRAHARQQQQKQQQQRQQQQEQQQLQISGAVRSAAPAALHPLHADAQVAAAGSAAASGGWRSSDAPSVLREVRSGKLHAETSDEEGTAAAAAAAAAAADKQRSRGHQDQEARQQQQQQQQQQQNEGESEEQKCERIAASIRFQAEADLSKRRAEWVSLCLAAL